MEVAGSIVRLFNRKLPSNFLTYGAIGYSPLDCSGAIGRFFRVAARCPFLIQNRTS